MRYRLRTLLIVLGVLPMLIAGVRWSIHDLAFRSTLAGLAESALDDAPTVGKAVIALGILAAVVVPVAFLACLMAGAFVKNRDMGAAHVTFHDPRCAVVDCGDGARRGRHHPRWAFWRGIKRGQA
jgi:zona occludens toxin (predicted ATPase)